MWKIELLGGLRARRGRRGDDEVVERFRTHKTGSLLALLAFQRRPVAREVLIGEVWPEASPQSGRNNLRIALSSLRRQLEPPDVLPGSILLANRATVALNPQTVTTDVASFELHCRAAFNTHERSLRLKHLQAACEIYGGALLPGFYENWILPQEQRLDALFARALRQLIADCQESGQVETAYEVLRRGLVLEPENITWKSLAASLQGTLERQESVPRSVAVAPSAPSALQTELDEQHQDSESKASLPPSLMRFVARETEMAQLSALLLDSPVRLVTLWGSGGCGKTRLALETVRRLNFAAAGASAALHSAAEESKFNAGPSLEAQVFGEPVEEAAVFEAIYFVPLAALNRAEFLVNAIGAVLPAPPKCEARASDAPLNVLLAALEGRRVLLVLDNFEQLMPDGAPVVRSLLERFPLVTILVTSRLRLRDPSERVLPLTPLPLPAQQPDEVSPAQAMEWASVKLFVDRAQRARPDFAITPRNARDIVLLVQKLEGLPLAIELAAARASVLSPHAMNLQLSAPLDFLARRLSAHTFHAASTCSVEAAASRHDALRTCIRWSFGLLEPELQRFWTRLSLFRGGWSLEAAREIGADDSEIRAVQSGTSSGETATAGPRILEWLEHLCDASLLTLLSRSDDPLPRFGMPETLREFAAEQLLPAEKEQLEARHSRFFIALAEQIEEHFNATGRWLNNPDVEADNWRAIFERAQAQPMSSTSPAFSTVPAAAVQRRESALCLAGALWCFWALRGHLHEGRTITSALLPVYVNQSGEIELADEIVADGASRHAGIIARAQWCAGILAFHAGENAEARTRLQFARDGFARLNHRFAAAAAWNYLGALALAQNDVADARENYGASLHIYRTLPNPQHPDQRHLAIALSCMSNVEYAAGDFACARRYIGEAMPLWHRLKDNGGMAWLLGTEGWMAEIEGDLSTAYAFQERALAIRRLTNSPHGIANALCDIGRVAQAQGNFAEARDCYGQSLQRRVHFGQRREILYTLEGMAGVFPANNLAAAKRAAQVLGAAQNLRVLWQYERTTHIAAVFERSLQRLQTTLDADVLRAALVIGRTLSLEEAVQLALREEI